MATSAFERSRWRGGRVRVIPFWRGNCDGSFGLFSFGNFSGSNFGSLRNTIAIEYPLSNCPAKFGRLPSNDPDPAIDWCACPQIFPPGYLR
jgi:hypothetical protein